jgi:outer membrane protein OmpA-like peptidoglycan-associated protein
MRLRNWLVTGISLGFLALSPVLAWADDAPAPTPPADVAAVEMPKACVDAGLKTKEECDALLAKAKEAKPVEVKPAEVKPAEVKPVEPKAVEAPAVVAPADNAAAPAATDQKPKRVRLAKDCVAAGAQTQEECDAFHAANAAKPATPAVAAPVDNAPAAAAVAAPADNTPAPAATDQKPKRVRLAKDCVAAGAKTQEECDAFHAASAAKPATPAVVAPADNAPAAAAVAPADNTPAPAATDTAKPKPLRLAKDCVAAGAKTQEECDAFHAANAAKPATPAVVAPADNAPAAAAVAPADNAPAPAATDTAKPKPLRLAKDCVDAGLKTKEECDALHAIATQNGKAPAAPADQTPPTATAGTLPAEVTPAKPTQTPVEPVVAAPALPDIETGLDAAAKSYNKAIIALGKANGDPAATDKARAEITVQQKKIDALCKSNKFDSAAQCLAQYGIELAQLPADQAPAGQPVIKPVQPVEVIANLPKGISQQDVAPLLDSAKDTETGKNGQAQTPVSQVAAAPSAPPPTDDKSAQAKLKFKPGAIASIDQAKGQQIDPNAASQVQVPQNVTIINQTVVNNTTSTTTNNTTNNTQNNNGPGAQVNVDQNGQPIANQPGKPGNGRPGNGRPNNGGPGNGRPGDNEPANPIGLGLGIILQLGNQLIINSPAQDQQRISDNDQDRTTYERLPNDRYRETITRPNGVRIVTVYNRNGDVLRRSRFDRNGHETVLAYFDDSHDQDLLQWRDPGQDLPPLQLHIPARDYVLDADQADQGQVQDFFAQPPVEQVQRLYSIDEVKRSSRIRDMVRRLEIGDLTFDTGAATISQDQVGALSKVANAMLALLDQNPAETFLIEGHTDAVGSDISNLQLSDARAATVAKILADFYHIPPENLATQGYGERYLKVQTDGPERLNRRVTIRRITSLVTVANQAN